MGLLPSGTGNLLARNIGLPLDIADGLDVALTGRNRHIDVGWLTLDPTTEQGSTRELDPSHAGPTEPDVGADDTHGSDPADNQHAFLVMAGLGLDASHHGTRRPRGGRGPHGLGQPRRRVAPRNLARSPASRHPGCASTASGAHQRTPLAPSSSATAGASPGGITLMPDAEVDDGILDVVAITPKGIVGWAGVAVHVLAKRGSDLQGGPLPLPVDPRVARCGPDGRGRRGDVIGSRQGGALSRCAKALIVRTSGTANRVWSDPQEGGGLSGVGVGALASPRCPGWGTPCGR